jgi:branched-chain amino acid transport system permease protein
MKFWGVRLVSVLLAFGFALALDRFAAGQSDFTQRLIVLAGLYITLSVSLNLINGITGQFSIGHAAFYQIGAYTAGFLSVKYFADQSAFSGFTWLLLLIVVGAVAAAIAGVVVGLPSLRLRGDYLAIVTLGFGEIIRIIVQNQNALGGSYGMNVQPKFQAIFGSSGTTGVWLVWILAIVCIAVCRNLLKTAHGLPFLSVREDEVASAAMGVNVTRVKVTAFVIGSAFAGAAGALLAHFEGFISPQMFQMELSFILLTMVVLGGTGSITGSAVAAVLLFYLPEKLRDLAAVSGASLVASVIAVIAAVVIIKKIADHYHGPAGRKAGFIVGTIVGAVVLQIVLGLLLSFIPTLKEATFEAARLRMVIFAATLIILMLLRPQGVFGHHEFSWTWLRRVFGFQRAKEAAA